MSTEAKCGNCYFHKSEKHKIINPLLAKDSITVTHVICKRFPTSERTYETNWCGEHKELTQ